MIPKKIHYIWVGDEKPKDIKKCLKTWKKKFKGYEIIEWNEKNFDINSHHFAKEAYKAKKWAFVSDYIRAKVMYEYGGIYLDADIVAIKNFDKLLNNKGFVGFENDNYIFTACFGMEPKHPFMKELLDYYDNIEFEYKKENEMDYVNTKIFSDILVNKYKLIINNKEQTLNHDIKVYPDWLLCNPSNKSITVHIFYGTWIENYIVWKCKLVRYIKVRLTNRFLTGLYGLIVNKRYIKNK